MKPNPLAFAFSPFGRLSRKGYWIVLPVLLVVRIALSAAADAGPGALSLEIVLGVLSVLGAWSSFAVVTRRLHDFGMDVAPVYLAWVGGWMLFFFAALASTLIFKWDAQPIGLVAGAIALVAQVGFLIWVGVRPGAPHRNRHGRGGSAQTSDAPVLTGYLAP